MEFRMTSEPGDKIHDDYDWGEEAATFGDRLALAREHAGMDQAQLARRLGVKFQTLLNWETDRAEPRANRLQMLAGLLNVSMVWLMTGDGVGAPAEGEALGGEEAPSQLREVMGELREIRRLQTRLTTRTGLLERRLRDLPAAV